MAFSLADATALTAIPGVILAVLAFRTKTAKKSALEQLIASVTHQRDAQWQRQVDWLEKQIAWYQGQGAQPSDHGPGNPAGSEWRPDPLHDPTAEG